MERFSERQGKETKKLQIESIDKDLRTRIWNQFYDVINLDSHERGFGINSQVLAGTRTISLYKNLWSNFFIYKADECPVNDDYAEFEEVVKILKETIFNGEWNEVYDLIEFVIENWPYNVALKKTFVAGLNKVHEEEYSGYRIIGKFVTLITTEGEIEEIGKGLRHEIDVVREHLETALRLYSDRKSPDYRNSIKESISAVESLCKIIVGNDSVTLGKALDSISKQGKVNLHPALKDAFKKLYGYTSDAGGIRHGQGLDDSTDLNQEDARWMLISCSAFINYLTVKSNKAGIEF